jgi:F-type H+-transporting ATPase subunit beta
MSTGKIVQVMGAVVDCEFPVGSLPHLMNALRIDQAADKSLGTPETHLTLEVALHLGENRVRTVAMSSTDGLMRGMTVNDTGKAICMPVGKEVLGRIMNVIGEPVDEMGPITT